jgi:cation:H+ antiporter
VLVGVYGYGLRLINETSEAPMGRAVPTSDTRPDEPDEPASDDGAPAGMWLRFAVLAAVLGGAGTVLAVAGESVVAATGLGEAAVGVFMTGVGSSLAELVVSISAIRAGALTLAVANVIGGNTFDTLLVGAADVAYRDGSVYAAVGDEQMMVASLVLVATAVLSLGLLRRERHGLGNIGLESVVILLVYAVTALLLF